MKKTIVLKAAYILSLVLLCTNFSSFARLKRRAKKETPTEAKISPKEREYNLKVGDTFTISLPENPSTGKTWSWLVGEPEQERWLKLIKSEYKPDNTNVTGGKGMREFTFQAQNSTDEGRFRQDFVYGPPSHGEYWGTREISIFIS